MKVLLPYLGQKSVWCILRGLSRVLYSAPLLQVYLFPRESTEFSFHSLSLLRLLLLVLTALEK